MDHYKQDGTTMSASEFIEETYQNLLGALIVERQAQENHMFAREIAVVITETEKAYAYFKTYVQPNLEEK